MVPASSGDDECKLRGGARVRKGAALRVQWVNPFENLAHSLRAMAIVLILLGLAVLRFAVVAVGVALLIRPVRACPACCGETVAIRRPWLARLAPGYEWRWCSGCRWQGLARREPAGNAALKRSA